MRGVPYLFRYDLYTAHDHFPSTESDSGLIILRRLPEDR